jgi:hypothetical protein
MSKQITLSPTTNKQLLKTQDDYVRASIDVLVRDQIRKKYFGITFIDLVQEHFKSIVKLSKHQLDLMTTQFGSIEDTFAEGRICRKVRKQIEIHGKVILPVCDMEVYPDWKREMISIEQIKVQAKRRFNKNKNMTEEQMINAELDRHIVGPTKGKKADGYLIPRRDDLFYIRWLNKYATTATKHKDGHIPHILAAVAANVISEEDGKEMLRKMNEPYRKSLSNIRLLNNNKEGA